MSQLWSQRRSEVAPARPSDIRSPFERDRDRVLRSASFRRLQATTQIYGPGTDDFPRTRLTHSLEVAQVGRALARNLAHKYPSMAEGDALPHMDLVEAVCMAHDLGHPPFGHGGERGLQRCMSDNGGFEGNGQTLRVLTRLEHHTRGFGLDPTRRSLLGILKYPISYSEAVPHGAEIEPHRAPKCFFDSESEVVQWILEPFDPAEWKEAVQIERRPGGVLVKHNPTLDCSILGLADDTAYSVHDLEDAVQVGAIKEGEFVEDCDLGPETDKWLKHVGLGGSDALIAGMFRGDQCDRKAIVGGLINAFITSASLKARNGLTDPLLRWQVEVPDIAAELLVNLKMSIFHRVIQSKEVVAEVFAGERILKGLFEAMLSQPRIMGGRELEKGEDLHRRVCDHIASLSDVSAQRMHAKLFGGARASAPRADSMTMR